jgi:PAS domain S-box-containing protein
MGTVVRGQSNQMLGFLSIIRDITQRTEMEQAWRAQEAQLRQIIDLVPHMIFVKNREGRFLLVNQAQADMYGTTVERLTGSLIHDHHLSDETVEQFLADDRAVMDSGLPRVIDEEVLYDSTGAIHIVQTSKIPYNLAGADEQAVLGVAIDLTRQKQAELLLRQSNALLETSRNVLTNLIAQLPIGIQIFNKHGICVDVNQSFLDIFGVEDVGQLINTYNIFEDELADLMGTSIAARQALNGEVVQMGDLPFNFERADGRFARTAGERVINVIIFPVLDRDQNVTNIVGLNTDVTERTLAEKTRLEVAIHKERIDVLEELISTISHDFKTPLTIIGTSLYLFERLTTDETASKHIRRIEEQLTRLANLITSLLTMSRLIGISDLSFLVSDLNMIVYNVYAAKTSLAEAKSVNMSHVAAQDLPRILAADELTIAINNLIDNAILFTPPGGSVMVSTIKGDQFAVVEVKDTGVGIPQDEISDVFERFYRTDKARSTDTGGAGLGLAITKQIVDLHDGRIEVSSKLTEGSTFRVILPTLPESD